MTCFIPKKVSSQLYYKGLCVTTLNQRVGKRRLSFDGVDVMVYFSFPKSDNEGVLHAHVLVSGKTSAPNKYMFHKHTAHWEHGTHIVYSLTNWFLVMQFLERLPRMLPQDMITIPKLMNGNPMQIEAFLDHIEYGTWDYYCDYRRFSTLRDLVHELKSTGIAA
jgi:hypothetical protein